MIKFIFLLFIVSCAHLGNKSIILPQGQTYLEVGTGKVHRTCLEHFGQKLLPLISETTDQGLACLKRIKGRGGRAHYAGLKALYDEKSITYSCHEKNFDWGKVAAHASLSEKWNIPEYDLVHPFISINPEIILTGVDSKGKIYDEDFIKEALFHESFHHLGYAHGITPEYAYACEECCFPRIGGDVEASCKICSKEYADVGSEEYLQDFWEWANTSMYKESMKPQVVLRNALIARPGSEIHLKYLFETGHRENLALKYFGKDLRPRSYIMLYRNLTVDPLDEALIPLAKAVAEAQEKMYLRGDFKSVIPYYQNLDVNVLTKSVASVALMDAILYDMETIFSHLKIDRSVEMEGFLLSYRNVWQKFQSSK